MIPSEGWFWLEQ